MKKIQATIIMEIGLLLAAPVFAHGGIEKNVGNAIVFVTQSPISPLLGERVSFTFVLKDKDYSTFANQDVTLRVIDTAFNDAANDKTIETVDERTDNNGAFDFSYTFHKENYFDMEVTFADPKDKIEDTTGFLVQPRQVPDKSSLVGAAIAGLFLGVVLTKKFLK